MRPNTKALRRFFIQITVTPDGCWRWDGTRNRRGYGHFECAGIAGAHRIAYAWFVAPIPVGHVIDHLCRNPRCVNPGHLDAVTQSENVRRGRASLLREACKRGHAMTPANVFLQRNYGVVFRSCLVCRLMRENRRREKRRLVKLAGVRLQERFA